MTNLLSHFLNTLLTIPQVFGGLTLTLTLTFTSSNPRGAFAPKKSIQTTMRQYYKKLEPQMKHP